MNLKPVATIDYLDLKRFMGDWYVIASIPTFIEKHAYNAVESYQLNKDGTVATIFTFLEGGFDGKPKRYAPTGYVTDDKSNAVWGMQFIWPIKADYRVIYLNDAYDQTVIARNKRDYAWIMARTPEISEADLQAMIELLQDQGYDITQLRKVPQRWDTAQPIGLNKSGAT